MKKFKLSLIILLLVGIQQSSFGQVSQLEGRLSISNPDTVKFLMERTGSGQWDIEMMNVGGRLFMNGGNNGTAPSLKTFIRLIPFDQDASLTGNGMLMLGLESGENLLLDKNEMMSRNNGTYAPLFIQREGGSTFINSLGGTVGIATESLANGYSLSVGGKVACEEVRVELEGDWPDYVFQENYQLPKLKEVQNHISKKGHLIGVPSAEEIENNGISLREMNKVLLEKIEELTLYILEQEKKINTLVSKETSLTKLEERIKALENNKK